MTAISWSGELVQAAGGMQHGIAGGGKFSRLFADGSASYFAARPSVNSIEVPLGSVMNAIFRPILADASV